nr:14384_t:CDS:2 [Entrophospora candida]
MSIDKRIDNAALSPTSIIQIFDNDTNNNEYFTRNNEIQKCCVCAATYSGIGKTSTENFMKTKVMINWIIMNMQPFSIVEDNFFIEMIKKFDPPYQMPCHVKNKISLTLDIWISENSHTSFLGVTCHYINDEWKLKHFLLDIIPFHESHSAENMVNAVKILLEELVEKYLLLVKENECNPLMWWCTHKETFPSLSELAKDYLAIQSTSVPCEQSFSVAGLTISKLRNRLDPETS